MILLLQARGRMTATALAAELEVSVRTIYRDLEALSSAGVPVFAESGPGGGCELLAGYEAPLARLTVDEAEALLVLGVPQPLQELGLGGALTDAHRHVRSAAPLRGPAPATLVHLDMPRWFHSREAVPHLITVATAVRRRERIAITYRRGEHGATRERAVEPLGVVNKAGVWYLVAATAPARTTVFRVARIRSARPLGERFDRAAEFDLVAFWDAWSAEFEGSRPRIQVTVRASPDAMRALPEIFGDAVRAAIDGAGPPDAAGWSSLTLTFEDERAAVYRLAGLGGVVEVVSPAAVRDGLVALAEATLRHHAGAVT
jgi:predicted DNA-binding transcriptional regulator YafY